MAATSVQLNLEVRGAVQPVRLFLDPTQFSHNIILSQLNNQQLYEPETSKLLLTALGKGDRFIDVGAHVGYFSMLAAAVVGPEGRVYAFEPEATNYQQLLEHMRVNGFAHVVPFAWAVGAASHVADLYINADNDGGHAMWDPGRHPFNQKSRDRVNRRPVFMLALDEMFANVAPGSIKAMKIDTEGNELEVLKGAVGLLSRVQVPLVVCEINRTGLKEMGASENDLRQFVTSLGYATYCITPENVVAPLAPDQTLDTRYAFNLYFVRPAWMEQFAATLKVASESPGSK